MMDNNALIGKQLGAYLIQAKLGEGGMARVYKAYHARLRRDVAIKVILPQVADKPGFKERFEQEAQVIARLEQRNIVAVYDFGEFGNLTYLVMQYVGGGTLRSQLRGNQPLELRRAITYAQQMARALHHAHQRGIVHRDVKPQNMLVSSSDPDELLLSDFGIAKLFDTPDATLPIMGSGTHNPLQTNVGQLIGTPDYMAPEQINRQPVDARTDVYALGVVLFQMLTGRVPFLASTEIGLLYQHVHTPAPDVRQFNAQVPEMLAQITTKALAKEPRGRFQTAEEMARALEMAISPSAYTPGTPLFDSAATISPLAWSTQPAPSQIQAASPPASYYGSQPQAQPRTQLSQPVPPRQSITDPITGASKLTTPRTTANAMLRPGTFAFSILLALLVIGTVIWQTHPSWLPIGSNIQTTGTTLQPFTENFHNNDRNWTTGNLNGLSADISNNQYSLSVSDNNTYFPHPDVGNLPTNFTYTVKMEQHTGATSVFYGLAFRLTENGSAVYCYAFVINSNGDYEVLKYGVNTPSKYAILTQSTLSAIHGINQTNTLQTIVKGSSFSFKINSTQVAVITHMDGYDPASSTSTATPVTVTDSSYTDGQPALMVAGPDTSFTVTSAQVSSP
ncbi:MAG TPA: protein kinase [Ktedonobacteraceae bacterium]|nr:protein kinase [Ktedonobacteraceae bacterium]